MKALGTILQVLGVGSFLVYILCVFSFVKVESFFGGLLFVSLAGFLWPLGEYIRNREEKVNLVVSIFCFIGIIYIICQL